MRTQCETHPKGRRKTLDYVTPNAKLTRQSALMYIFEDNEVVIKMIIKDRGPTTRHDSRTHRVDSRLVVRQVQP